jgi:hypothetical protein
MKKHSDHRVIVRYKELHEIAPGDAGAISFNLLGFGVWVKQTRKPIAK